MDETIKKNLIAQVEQLHDLQALIDEEIEGSADPNEIKELRTRSKAIREVLESSGVSVPEVGTTDEVEVPQETSTKIATYAQVTQANLAYLHEKRLIDRKFDTLFTKEELLRIDRELSSPIEREQWDKWDFVAVLTGGVAGVVADFFSEGIDQHLKEWLGRYEITTPKVSIDYQGKGFGGKYHRGLSAGHDILRIFETIWQIKNGTFVGLKQTREGFEWITSTVTQHGNPFDTYGGFESFFIWVKHLASDFVTDTSLPFPGMSYLMEMPDHEIRKFAIQMYKSGYNLRYILVQALAPALVELIVRGYLLGREFVENHQITFPTAKRLKVTEMLLTSHAIVTAINAGKVIVRCNAEGPLALKQLNIPSTLATVRYFIPFVIKIMKRNDPVEILIRNAQAIMDSYDTSLQELRGQLDQDSSFQAFLTDGQPIVVG